MVRILDDRTSSMGQREIEGRLGTPGRVNSMCKGQRVGGATMYLRTESSLV